MFLLKIIRIKAKNDLINIIIMSIRYDFYLIILIIIIPKSDCVIITSAYNVTFK